MKEKDVIKQGYAKELLNVAIKRKKVIKMLATVFSRIDKMRPSEYAKIFYAECARRGAKFICSCGYEEDWQNREHEVEHCNRRDKGCSGVMVLTINKEGG